MRPPATLYQTRPARAPMLPLESPPLPVLPPVQRSAKGKGRPWPKRPGTGDSEQALLLGDEPTEEGLSLVYMYYRHSLNSLTDIINTVRFSSSSPGHVRLTARARV